MQCWCKWFPLVAASCGSLCAQARPTAEHRLHPSAFVLFSDTYTGLAGSPDNFTTTDPGLGGRNFTLTAGGDLGLLLIRHYDLAAEVRGTYPINEGRIDGQKSLLGGLRLSREPGGKALSRLRPYADALAGRGSMHYLGGGYLVPGLLYTQTAAAVYGLGGGFEVDITQRLSLKADAQFQRWTTPVTQSGAVHSSQGGVGVVYRYGAGAGPR